MYSETFDYDVERDLPNIRVVDLRFNKVIFEREDPYGFWRAHLDKGALPERLTGEFTSYEDVFRAVMNYMTEKKRTMEFKQPVTRKIKDE